MTTSAHDPSTALEYSVSEAWVIHAALAVALDASVTESDTDAAKQSDGEEQSETEPLATANVLERIETDATTFTGAELAIIHDSLVDYLTSAPLRDRSAARSVLSRINATLQAV